MNDRQGLWTPNQESVHLLARSRGGGMGSASSSCHNLSSSHTRAHPAAVKLYTWPPSHTSLPAVPPSRVTFTLQPIFFLPTYSDTVQSLPREVLSAPSGWGRRLQLSSPADTILTTALSECSYETVRSGMLAFIHTILLKPVTVSHTQQILNIFLN